MLNFFKRKLKYRESYEQFNHDINENHKTRFDLIRLSAIVCGIEFCYAAETAFVSPILLQLGLPVIFMSWIWCLPPLIGFFLVPILGSLSDKCQTRIGRRRPFIIIYSIGILTGLLLVANGRRIGQWFGDTQNLPFKMNRASANITIESDSLISYKFGTTMTIVGVVLLDLDCDACQSPSRAYLLDVTSPDQHSAGLTIFTSMAGLGGSLGYFLGGIPWEKTILTQILGDHVHVLFTLVWIIYIICMILSVTAAKEPNITAIMATNLSRSTSRQFLISSYSSMININEESDQYEQTAIKPRDRYTSISSNSMKISYVDYLKSIIYMPTSLRWLCLTNFFCWMALVSYSLYFTDFVGQAVYGGDPAYESNHPLRILYNDGVRFGSWGMSIYSISCSIYSFNIQKLNHHFGIKRVYIGSQLIYATGMLLMGYLRHRIAVIVLSAVSGMLYSTLFTIPFLLISKYYTSNTYGQTNFDRQIRGIGTDVAIVSSMVFLAQLCLSSTMGTLIHLADSTVVVTIIASVLSVCGAISATQVLYI
ncbi:unnamed protein product [Adineta ricciae]|uniref:Uncharacterized protein n=1 Tax=Adineta ricciae TaxID=249248 RepID=A0A813W8W5_ADIRI|nr:unnamed protein product [Adineta ricciae]